jgi:hypothetical protein
MGKINMQFFYRFTSLVVTLSKDFKKKETADAQMNKKFKFANLR